MSIHRSVNQGDLQVSMRGSPPQEECALSELFRWLCGPAGAQFRGVFHSLCCWGAFVLEQSKWWLAMSSDAVLDAPVPQGPKRARRLDPNLRQQLGKMASEGDLSRTGGHAVKVMARMRQWNIKKMCQRTGQKTVEHRVATYAEEVQGTLSGENVNIVSLAFDGTRMSGKDTLHCDVYSPELQLASWAPPQAGPNPHKRACTMIRFSPRICLHVFAVFRRFLHTFAV